MVGNQDLLGEAKKHVKKYGMSPLSYEKGFEGIFRLIDMKLYLFTQLGVKRHNVGEIKAWLDILDLMVNLSARVGYDDSNVPFADHAFYNHKDKLEELRKLVKENYVP